MVLGVDNLVGDPYLANVNEWIVTDTAGGVVHIHLPKITAATAGLSVAFTKDSTGSFNNVRITTTGSDKVDKTATFFDIITSFGNQVVVSDGVGFWWRYKSL